MYVLGLDPDYSIQQLYGAEFLQYDGTRIMQMEIVVGMNESMNGEVFSRIRNCLILVCIIAETPFLGSKHWHSLFFDFFVIAEMG